VSGVYNLLLIGLGGFLGAVLRYLIGGWIQDGFLSFPVGTLTVNATGSFILSLIMYLSEYEGLFGDNARIFLTIGFLGSFTTMSTFSYESFRFLEQKEIFLFALNLVGTIISTLLAVYLGRVVAVGLWRH
jgi:CrcB protein